MAHHGTTNNTANIDDEEQQQHHGTTNDTTTNNITNNIPKNIPNKAAAAADDDDGSIMACWAFNRCNSEYGSVSPTSLSIVLSELGFDDEHIHDIISRIDAAMDLNMDLDDVRKAMSMKKSVPIYEAGSWRDLVDRFHGQPPGIRPCNRPPRGQDWRLVRVFVSSTFRDMHADREILIKDVFKNLTMYCRSLKLHLLVTDLRWGIEAGTTGTETLRICLSELDRCKADNGYPFYLYLGGERYGWIPQSKDVSEDVRHRWGWLCGSSVTSMEVAEGAFRFHNPNALFAFRNSEFLEQKEFLALGPSEYAGFVDVIWDAEGKPTGDRDPSMNAKQAEMKQAITDRFGGEKGQVFEYTCTFAGVEPDTGKVLLNGLAPLGQAVSKWFERRIALEYPLSGPTGGGGGDVIAMQRRFHSDFVETRSLIFVGRSALLSKLESISASAAASHPTLVVAVPGNGKSALLASFAKGLRNNSNNNVICHFVGAAPSSTSLHALVRRLLLEISRIATGGDDVGGNLPTDYPELCATLNWHLNKLGETMAAKNEITTIIVDAINQLDDAEVDEHGAQQAIKWIPLDLPPRINLVMSCIPGHTLDAIRSKQSTAGVVEVPLDPLDKPDAQEMICCMLKMHNKRLDAAHMETLLSKGECSRSPLWLAIAAEELRVFGIFEKLGSMVLNIAASVHALFSQVFSRLEMQHGMSATGAVLMALYAAKEGLLETEIVSLLQSDALVRSAESIIVATRELASPSSSSSSSSFSPSSTWSGLRSDLDFCLRPGGDNGAGLVGFWHGEAFAAVSMHYGFTPATLQPLRIEMANVFDSSVAVVTIDRKAVELPHQLSLCSGCQDRLRDVVADPAIIGILYSGPENKTKLFSYWQQTGGYACESNAARSCGEMCLKNLLSLPKDQVTYSTLVSVGCFLSEVACFAQSSKILHEALFHLPSNDDLGMLLFHCGTMLLRSSYVTSSSLVMKAALYSLGESHGYRSQMSLASVDVYALALWLKQAASTTSTPGATTEDRRALYETSLALKTAQMGPDHLEVARTCNHLGWICKDCGELGLSNDYITRGWDIRRRWLGDNHPDVADSLLYLGALRSAEGRLPEAKEAMQKARDIRMHHYGPEHPDVKTAETNLSAIEHKINLAAISSGDTNSTKNDNEETTMPSPSSTVVVVAASSSKLQSVRAECEQAMNEASEIVEYVNSRLSHIGKQDLAEVKAMFKLPPDVEKVMSGMLVLLGNAPSANEAKKLLSKPSFLQDMMEFDYRTLSEDTVAEVENKYLPDLSEERLKKMFRCGASLFCWVSGTCKLFRIYKKCEPLILYCKKLEEEEGSTTTTSSELEQRMLIINSAVQKLTSTMAAISQKSMTNVNTSDSGHSWKWKEIIHEDGRWVLQAEGLGLYSGDAMTVWEQTVAADIKQSKLWVVSGDQLDIDPNLLREVEK